MDRVARQGTRRSHSRSYGDDEQRSIGARDAARRYRFLCYRPLGVRSSAFRRWRRPPEQRGDEEKNMTRRLGRLGKAVRGTDDDGRGKGEPNQASNG